MNTGWGDEVDCGFNQVSQQLQEMHRKMDTAITSQRQLKDELHELRTLQKPLKPKL